MNEPSQNPKPASTPSECDQLRELLPSYVIGGLDTDEKALVEKLLPRCPEAVQELREYAGLSQAMLYEAEPVQPPAYLHDRLMASLNAPAPETKAAPMSPTPAPVMTVQRPWPNRLWAAVALAASLLLVFSNIYWLLQVQELRVTQADVEALLNSERLVLATLGAGASQRVELRSTDAGTDQLYATLLWNPDVDRALLYTDQLPALPADRTYQVWLIDSTAPVSGGLFQVDAQGQGVLVFQPPAEISQFSAIAISSEPAQGSEAPTTTPLALGEI